MATPVSLMDDQMVDMALITQLTGLTDKWFYRNTGNLCQPSPVAVRQCSDTGYSAINHRNSTVVLY
ncbi:Rha family transcriptional regulator [Escherichia coli]|uniref:Rha family transcriptional regulator n=1 Tax=Escherichia coli TaxID=562 RepID=UPI002852B3EE|nr:Rha family transcriptional regulator [Escherichia coli]